MYKNLNIYMSKNIPDYDLLYNYIALRRTYFLCIFTKLILIHINEKIIGWGNVIFKIFVKI